MSNKAEKGEQGSFNILNTLQILLSLVCVSAGIVIPIVHHRFLSLRGVYLLILYLSPFWGSMFALEFMKEGGND